MSTAPDVVTLTMNPAVDVSCRVDRVQADVKLRCSAPTRRAGGGGLNVARVIARLGSPVTAIHTSGGPSGALLKSLLRDEGIRGRAVNVGGETRENLVVAEREAEQSFHFVMPGPTLSVPEWEACLELAASPGAPFVVASGSLPPGVPQDFYAQLAQRVRASGSRLALDASGEPLRLALEVGVWLTKPNDTELAALCGVREGDEESLVEAAHRLVERGSTELVVLSLGSAGAYVAGKGLDGEHLRSPVVPVRSRVGAGDSMVGAMVAGSAQGMDTEAIARLGVAAGAAAVMQDGSEVAQAADVWRLFSRLQRPARIGT